MNSDSSPALLSEDIDALVIGRGSLPDAVRENLGFRHLATEAVRDQKQIPLSRSPGFVFWFPIVATEHLSELLLNYCRSLEARLTIVYLDQQIEEDILAQCIEAGLDVRIILVNDLYGPGVVESTISIVWSRTQEKAVVVVENDDVHITPVYLDDAASGVCLAAFSSQTYNKVLLVSGEEEIAVLSFAYRLKEEFERQLRTSFRIERSPVEINHWAWEHQKRLQIRESKSLISWHQETPLVSGLTRIVESEIGKAQSNKATGESPKDSKKKIDNHPERSTSNAQTKRPEEVIPNNSARRFISAVTILIFIGVVIVTAPIVSVGLINLKVERMRADQEKLENQSLYSQALNINHQSARWVRIGELIRENLSLLPAGSIGVSTERIEADQERLLLSQRTASLAQEIVGTSNDHPLDLLTKIESSIGLLLTRFEQEQSLRKQLSLARELLPVTHWVLGFDHKRTILLIVEDSTELRPTGGFMRGFLFLTFDKGRLLDVNVADSYEIDASLIGHEDAPEPIRRFLGESRWLARDANWDPDGPRSAKRIQTMVSRATGRSIDAVVFLTALGIKDVLSATGPVTHSSGDVISSDNILDRVVYTSSIKETGEARKDVLVEAMMALQEQLESGHGEKVFRGIADAILHGELIMTAFDQQIERLLQVAGIDGRIHTPTCPIQFHSDTCIADGVYVVDSNLGVNRADYFLRRERLIETQIESSKPVTTTVTLIYENSAPSSDYPVGSYRGYTRIYLPATVIINALLDNSHNDPVAITASHEIQFGMREIGFDVEVPIGQRREFKIVYTIPVTLPLDQGIGGYHLFLQKQPGTGEVPTAMTLSYGRDLRPIVVSTEFKQTDSSLLFFFPLSISTGIAAEFESVFP